MNICCIIDNKILHCYFLEQSEQLIQLFEFSCVGWLCCAKPRMAHLSFVVWYQLARQREISFNRLGHFFNDDWCTGDDIKQKSHFFMVTWVVSLVLNNVQLYVQCYTVYTCICTMLYNMHMHIRKIPISQILLVGKLANILLNTHLCMIWTLSGSFDHGRD